MQRKLKGAKARSDVDDSVVRSVRIQNEQLLDQAISTSTMSMVAFNVVTKVPFKVVYGPSDRLGITSLTLFSMDGGIFLEWAISGLKDSRDHWLNYLKSHRIRLELTEADLINSKRTIYYL